MKKLSLFALLLIVAISCGPAEKKDYQLVSVGLTVTIPGETTINESAASEYMPAQTQFYIDHEGAEVIAMDEESFPTDLAMLETALTGTEGITKITEKKTLPNGAFGCVYDKLDNGETLKDFLFYFTKNGKYYKIIPISNEGEQYPELIEAIGTLK